MKVLVIGGTRFIGPLVARRLVEYGHEVTVFNRGETETSLPSETRRLRGGRQKLEDYAEELRRSAPEVVLDMLPMNERRSGKSSTPTNEKVSKTTRRSWWRKRLWKTLRYPGRCSACRPSTDPATTGTGFCPI